MMSSWGKRKDGQSYRKDKPSGTKRSGTTLASGTVLKKQHTQSLLINNKLQKKSTTWLKNRDKIEKELLNIEFGEGFDYETQKPLRIFKGDQKEFTNQRKAKHFLTSDGSVIGHGNEFHNNMASKVGYFDQTGLMADTGIVRVIAENYNPDQWADSPIEKIMNSKSKYLNLETHQPLTEPQLRKLAYHIKSNRIPSDQIFFEDYSENFEAINQLATRLQPEGSLIMPFEVSIRPEDHEKYKKYVAEPRKKEYDDYIDNL